MTDNQRDYRKEAIRAGIEQAREDFAMLAANRRNGFPLPADGALRNAWLAAYAGEFADLAHPATMEQRLVADDRAPRFYAGQRIEFARFEDIALGRAEWRAGEIAGYWAPHWQPLPAVSQWLRLDVRVIGKRDKPIGKRIAVSEYEVRLPQNAKVAA